jgi:nuclear mRNA export protein SAC3
MCPERERYVRDVQKNLNPYECDERGNMIPEKTVKDYSRSAADQEPLPHELRPAGVLNETMNYLVGVVGF